MSADIANTDQAEYWSSPEGQHWVTHQDLMDQLLSGVLDTVMDNAAPQAGETVLDIGCGTGASSLALARKVGQTGRVLAFDISQPLLDLARHRAKTEGLTQITPVLGDAQVHPFEREGADLVFSRFGVMFFKDPVAAFGNLLGATRPGGRLSMICWQGAPENPWFMVPMKAAMAHLGRPAPMDPHAPGPMAFKDTERVTGILGDAGWSNPQAEAIEVDLIPPDSARATAEMATTIGPATRLMREKNGTPEDLAAIRATTEAALEDFKTSDGLRIPARLILYSAHKA